VPDHARTTAIERQALSQWVTLVSRTLKRGDEPEQLYHSLSQADYVSVLAITPDGRIPLVRQYRPAVDRVTIELPGGLLDSHEAPAAAAARELSEEAGFAVEEEATLLGRLRPDTGRLENHYWCYFARARPIEGWRAERHVERVIWTQAGLRNAICDGTFDHALHIALIGMAAMRGQLHWPATC
jgi:ADP-ribose pyrophosphatase